MAKFASKVKENGSISAIFNDKLAVLATNSKRATSGNTSTHPHNKVRKGKTSKHKGPEEHPLSVAFAESIEDARSTIMDSKAASIKSVQDSLYERLDSVSAESDAMLKEAAAIKKIIFKPLGEERLALSTTVNGKTVTEITTLGKSMDNFRNLVDTKEKELKVLWEQWTAVQQEIINFGMDILGPEAFDGVATADGQYFYVKPRDKSDFMKENERLASEFEVERKNLEVDIQTMGEEAVQNMEACEKEFDARQRKQRKDLLSFMSAQL